MDDATLFNAALELHQAGRLDKAQILYAKLVRRNPRHFDGLHYFSIVAFQQGYPEEALRLVDEALAVNEAASAAHCNRGSYLLTLKRTTDALASFNRAIALNPADALAHVNRGVCLEALGNRVEALTCFERAIALNPAYAKAYCDRAAILLDLRRYEESLASSDHAIALEPNYTNAHDNRGIALTSLGRLDEALGAFDRAVAAQPDNAIAHRNRGGLLEKLGRFDQALASYDAALAHAPEMEQVAGSRLHLCMKMCDWNGFRDQAAAVLHGIDLGHLTSAPFPVLTLASTPRQQRKAAELFLAAKGAPDPTPLPGWAKAPRSKLRIGYFSADFFDHPVGHTICGLLEHHDRNRFEIVGFLAAKRPSDAIQQRLRAAMDGWEDVSALSDREAASRARTLEIDIAIDLMGHTSDSRPLLFSQGLAPIQAGYLGYPGSSGSPHLHYLIADRIVIPPEHRQHYSENIALLPHSFMTTDPTRRVAPEPVARAALGLPEKGFVFCGFNGAYKITPDVFDVWMRLLARVEGSVLWLSGLNTFAQANLRREAEMRGISAARLVFSGYAPLPDHLARHRAADLFLDTFDYGAHSTAVDALWAGLPIVTKIGQAFPSRVGASLLTALGLPELIVDTVDAYEAMAMDLAGNPAKLAAIKEKLAANRLSTPLFDTARFARNMEAAYVRMWERLQRGAAPEDFEIADPR